MTEPTPYAGRPATPAPGVSAPELRIARIRPQARRLLFSVLVLLAVAGAVGYFVGNLPPGWQDWMLLAAAGLVVLLLVVLPFVAWLAHVYTITTRRVLARQGLFSVRRREFEHVRGYSIEIRRGPLQRLWGAGTLTLRNGIEAPLRLRNIPGAQLVHETLIDQVEVNQILAHRQAQPLPAGPA